MAEPVSLAFLFGLPPEEAIAFLRRKGYAISWDWRGVWQEMQARAFTVAKAMRLDILQDIRASVDRAIAEGETFATFQRRLAPILKAKGWWGRQFVVDPDGTARVAQLGSPWRLRTIYETNLQTAYMAGRYAAFKANESDRPYWMYVAVMDGRTRPAHAALNGRIFRSDDAFWRHFYPPNGYNCFPAGVRVRADAELGLRTWYAGEMVELRTRAGQRLTVTANHPVLTTRGWLAARDVRQGDQALRDCGGIDAALAGVVDHAEPPTRVEDLFEALASQGFRVVPMAANDFHGDAALRQPEIHVAGADRHLVHEIGAETKQFSSHRHFRGAHARLGADADGTMRAALRHAVASDGVGAQDSRDVAGAGAQLLRQRALRDKSIAVQGECTQFNQLVAVPGSFPGGAELALDRAAVVPDRLPLQTLGIGSSSSDDASLAKEPGERVTATALVARELLEAHPSDIALDEVVSIRKFEWAGHVYDFQTRTGMIVAEGLIVHNCRCRVRALSAADIEARGLKVSNSNRYLKEDTQVDRDGFMYPSAYLKLPGMAQGVRPDQGWAYNPGREQARWDRAGLLPDCSDGALFFADEKACLPARPTQPTWKSLGRPDLREVGREDRLVAPALLPRAATVEEALATMERAVGLGADVLTRFVDTPISRVLLERQWLRHWVEKLAEHREQYGNFIIPTLERPFEVWLTEYGDGRIRPRYIGLFTGSHDLLVVVRENVDGGIVWNIMKADDKDMNGHRRGHLLWPRE